MGWSGREDLNLRPRRPERRALPGCATPRPKRPSYQPADEGSNPLNVLRASLPIVARMVARFLDRTDALLLAWTLAHEGRGPRDRLSSRCRSAIGGTPGFLEPWHRWDAPHYTDIAVFGYMANDPGNLSAPGYSQVFPGDLDLYIVFFPLFPWLIAAVNAVVGEPIVCGLPRRDGRLAVRGAAAVPPRVASTSATASASGRRGSSSSSRPRTSCTSATPRASSWRSPSARCGWRGRIAGGLAGAARPRWRR